MKKIVIIILLLMLGASVSYSESASAQLTELYAQAELLMATGDYNGAAEKFDALGAYSDSTQMAMYCKAIYAAESLHAFDMAIDAFTKLEDFKDCKQMVVYYTARAGEYVADLVLEKIASCPDKDLEDAKKYYTVASATYTQLSLFKDSLTRAINCEQKKDQIISETESRALSALESKYQKAFGLEGKKEYLAAIDIYNTIIDYKDSRERALACKAAYNDNIYQKALNERNAKKWGNAIQLFKQIEDYSDANIQISATYYMKGEDCLSLNDYDGAAQAFQKAGSYSDAATRVKDTYYKKGESMLLAKDWDGAVNAFESAGEYSNAKERISEAKYQKADELESLGKR